MRLIGFAGLKGSGKDTAASVLAAGGFTHVKMADGLKGMLRFLLEHQGVSPTTIDAAIEGHLKEAPSPFLGGRSPRHAMQTLGTEWGRNCMASDFWINVARERIERLDRVVISDVRFPNEVDLVHELGGAVYRIERGLPPTGLHESEAGILDLKVDRVIHNDFASAEDFKAFVLKLLFDLF